MSNSGAKRLITGRKAEKGELEEQVRVLLHIWKLRFAA
jgi:hypothetical protein